MATRNIPHTPRNHNDNQARREQALRIAQAMFVAARQAAEAHVIHSTAYQTTDPGPDFTPRAWR